MLEAQYQEYKDRVEFLFVYIREAHPADSNWGLGSRIDDPVTLSRRNEVAGMCTSKLKLSLPTLVDDMFDSVSMAYRAWPERIYVIDRKGKIAFKSGIGPWGFKPAAAIAAVDKLLQKSR